MAGPDVLHTPEAGPKVIRGGAMRFAGYAVGVLLGAAASVFLLRHLGVEEFGRYVTVMSLIAIVSGVTDAGLTVVGSRELAVRPAGEERDRLVANILALRLFLTPAGVLAAAGFAIAAGYSDEMVWGTLLAGAGIVLVNAQASLLLPLGVELKNGRVTVAEIVKQFVTFVGIAALAMAGASLLPFFAVQILVGVVVIAITPVLLGRRGLFRPRVDRAELGPLIRHALPIAAAFVLAHLYFRVLVILISLMSSEHETGLFATSFRILELLAGIPLMLAGVVLPVAAAAAATDLKRLTYVLQRVTEAAFVGAAGLAIVVAIAAEPLIVILGGEQYRGAGPILAIQTFALVGIFLSQAFTIGLLATRHQREIAITTALGLVSIFALGLALIPPLDSTGGAIAAVVADLLLAVFTFVALRHAGPGKTLRFGFVPRVAVAALAAGAIAFVPGVPELALAAVAAIVYAVVAYAVGAVPREVLDAFRRAAPASDSNAST
jgi:O-antigen/teichoic acid export membrane protein